MRFTNIRDLKYSIEDKSRIDLFATCQQYGEIPMTLILTDTEDLHTFFDGENEYTLEEYCKKQKILPYTKVELTQEQLIQQKIVEYKTFLDKTDKKVLPDYEFKEGDNSLEWYTEERSKARAFIRANEVI